MTAKTEGAYRVDVAVAGESTYASNGLRFDTTVMRVTSRSGDPKRSEGGTDMSNRARLIGGLLGAVLLALAGCSSGPSKAELDARFVAAWKADPPAQLLGGDSELSISNYGHLIQENDCTSSDNELALGHAILLDNSPDDVSAEALAISIYCPDRMAAWLGG